MDDTIVESNTIIAAGSVITKNSHIKSGSVYAGVPARKIKDVSKELKEGEIKRIAKNYLEYSKWFK